MTRDEAIEIETKQLRRHMNSHMDVGLIAAANIDTLVELGLLKVEKPESPVDMLVNQLMYAYKWQGGQRCVNELANAMHQLGYKLVKDCD